MFDASLLLCNSTAVMLYLMFLNMSSASKLSVFSFTPNELSWGSAGGGGPFFTGCACACGAGALNAEAEAPIAPFVGVLDRGAADAVVLVSSGTLPK
jgi:hypothetical protein